jgi:hypothetical protein
VTEPLNRWNPLKGWMTIPQADGYSSPDAEQADLAVDGRRRMKVALIVGTLRSWTPKRDPCDCRVEVMIWY